MSYELIWERQGVVKHFWGQVNDDDIKNAVNSLCADSRFDDLRYVLNDFTKVESHCVSKVALVDYAAERIGALKSNPRIISPFVASSSCALEIVEEVNSALLGTEHPWRIFPTIDEARAWLASYGL